jgi:uncharacterized membrane protein YgdD (TMEM256/DUF423 family)
MKSLFAYASFCLALSIALGAMGAHALEPRISAHYMDVWKTAGTYFSYQALALMAASSMVSINAWIKTSILGSWIFSASLWILALNELLSPSLKILGAITPIGGALMIVGWAGLGWKLWRERAS